MSVGRIVGTCLTTLAVAGGAGVVGMAHADPQHKTAAREARPVAVSSSRIPAQLPGARSTEPPSATPSDRPVAPSRARVTSAARTTAAPTLPTVSALPALPRITTPPPAPATSHVVRPAAPTPQATSPAQKVAPAPVRTTSAAPAPVRHTTAPRRGVRLPVAGSTGSASRVITVKAAHTWSTTATLQAWRKAPGGGWLRVGPRITAQVGADGLSRHPSESRSATPIGSFTLTQAFGYYANPGTSLHYFKTTGADWWISQSGRLYNTHQHCWSGCAFNQGSPNEHLMYETPFYNYAVVIDYNTRNSPTGVRQGAGSAFFLHVTDGNPTAGCVAIPQARLVPIMRWLLPRTHPRILIGT